MLDCDIISALMVCQVFRRTLSLTLISFLLTLALFAQNHDALLGKWKMTSESDNGPVEWALTLKDVDGKLAAFLVTDGAEAPAQNFTYSNGVLKFLAPYGGQDYTIELKSQGEKLEGTWSGGGSEGKTTGVKSKP